MTHLEKLHNLVGTLPAHMAELCNVVLNDPAFAEAPGGRSHHHNYRGGLAEHTLEVALHADAMSRGMENCQAIVAAVFHDYGKIHEYVFKEDGTIAVTPFCSQIGHPAWSWHVFVNAAEARNFAPSWIEEVGHALLAHMGRYEWRSPCEPQTRLAFILHTADMLSAKGITQ